MTEGQTVLVWPNTRKSSNAHKQAAAQKMGGPVPNRSTGYSGAERPLFIEEDIDMSETLATLKNRRSCRAYKPEHVEKEKLDAILEAGTYAATGMGKQSPIILVIRDPEVRNCLMKINAAAMGVDMDPFYGAPDLLVVLANKDIPTYVYDGSLVMGNMMNAAADLGVASCWIHRAKEEFESEEGKALLKKLGIEGNYEGIGNLILGYAAKPAGNAAPRKADYVYTV